MRFVGRINSCQLIIVVSKVPLQKQFLVGEFSSFWNFLNNLQHFQSSRQLLYFLLTYQLSAFQSSQMAQIGDESGDRFQEVIVKSGTDSV